jgi:hypothetical protein
MGPTLQTGSRGPDVVRLQHLLIRLLHVKPPPLQADGVFGLKTAQAVIAFQQRNSLTPDGIVGPQTWRVLNAKAVVNPNRAGCAALISGRSGAPAATPVGQIAWGAKVSPAFKAKVIQICNDLGINPSYLMACMAFETGETFSPSIPNAAGSGAIGLIQFMPSTAAHLGTSTAALAAMSAEAQLDYVKKYFQSYKGKLHTLEDVYMAILYPKAIGMGADSTLFQAGTKLYTQNKGFDANHDGVITPAEVSAKVRAEYQKGLRPGFVG